MSARSIRRSFATPFVVTLPLAACGPSQSHVYRNPPPPDREPAPRPDHSVTEPAPEPGAEVMNTERHWTVMKTGDTCQVYENVTCPAQATCNPPPPRAYACIAEVTTTAPVKIMRPAGQTECMVEREMPQCPPNTMCNPPPPQKVACPE